MVDMHEPVRPTGLHALILIGWLVKRQGEMNSMRGVLGNAPDHETILPFTRLMGGPMDYTPGIFKIKMKVRSE